MKIFIRYFFKALRIMLGPVMLLKERLQRPAGMVRTPEAQQSADAQCQSLTLYHYKTCPFCMKVRQEMRRLSLNIRHLTPNPKAATAQRWSPAAAWPKYPA